MFGSFLNFLSKIISSRKYEALTKISQSKNVFFARHYNAHGLQERASLFMNQTHTDAKPVISLADCLPGSVEKDQRKNVHITTHKHMFFLYHCL